MVKRKGDRTMKNFTNYRKRTLDALEEIYNRTVNNHAFYEKKEAPLHEANERGCKDAIAHCLYWYIGQNNFSNRAEAISTALSVYAVGFESYKESKEKEYCFGDHIYDIGYLRGVAYCLDELTEEEKGFYDVLSTMSLIDKAFDPNTFMAAIEEQNKILVPEKVKMYGWKVK